MTDRLSELVDRFRSAEAAVDASQAHLRKRSAERLASLLALSPDERLRSLGDPGLTPFDREQLEQSVRAALPRFRPRRVEAPSFRIRQLWHILWRHRRVILRGAVALVPVLYFGTRAVLATPAQAVPVTVNAPLSVNWYMPEGSRESHEVAAGSEEVWVLSNGEGRLRRWFPGRGYAVSPVVPETFLTDGTITAR